jgi:hypothetical protein
MNRPAVCLPEEGEMGIVIAFPADRCSAGSGLAGAQDGGGSVLILPVVRVERHTDPSDGLEPSTSSPRGKRRKR